MRFIPWATVLASQLLTCVFASHVLAEEEKKEPPNEDSRNPLLAQVLTLQGKGLPPDSAVDHTIRVLNKVVNLSYHDTPISEALDDLRLRFGTAMYVDEPALTAAKISRRARFTFTQKQTPLFASLHDMARTQNLTFHYRYHAIWLTTPQGAKDWKDPSGTLGLKPVKGSPLEKALSQPVKFDFLLTPMTDLPAALKEHHGIKTEIAALPIPAEKREEPTRANELEKAFPLRDALGILFTLEDCRCHEKEGVLVIEPREKLK